MRKYLAKIRKKLPKNTPLILAVVFLVLAISGSAAVLVSQGLVKKPQVFAPGAPEITKLPERVKVLQDKVTLERDGQKNNLEVGEGKEVLPGDKITTDLNGIAELVYQSGTVARIGQNSEIIFTNPDNLMQSV